MLRVTFVSTKDQDYSVKEALLKEVSDVMLSKVYLRIQTILCSVISEELVALLNLMIEKV